MSRTPRPFIAATVMTVMLLFCWGFSELFGIPHEITFEKARLVVVALYTCAIWSYWTS